MRFPRSVSLHELTVLESREPISFSALPAPFTTSPLLGFIAVALLTLPCPVHAATSSRQSPDVTASYRACSIATPETAVPLKSKRKKDIRLQNRGDIAPYCLEVRAPAMDVQGHLQSFVRKLRWAISDEDMNDYLWSFNLALTKDELLSYGHAEPPAERVNWQNGKAVVLIRSIDLGDGYSRSTITAQFTAFGESEDTFAMRRTTWTWASNGKLESLLIAELRHHFQPDH
jgi:hypothetical protein